MNISSFHRLGLKLALLALLALPGISQAQFFTDTENGDVVASFRKTGTAQENFEMVVYLGNIADFLALPPGSQTNISNYTHQQLTTMCPDNLNRLQWAVFSSFYNDPLVTPMGNFPAPTCWFTVPRTNLAVQTVAPFRSNPNGETSLENRIVGVSDGALSLASEYLGATNVNDNTLVLLEPTTYDSSTSFTLTDFIGDRVNAAVGDFHGDVLSVPVENTTSNNFNVAAISDFYQDVPFSTASLGTYTDPITGQTNGSCYYVGFFTLSTSGTLTFTRANPSTTVAAPIAAFSGTPTSGFAPLHVNFNDASTGSISNWLWNLGDGTFVTNGTSTSVSHTYANAGTYSVSLTVTGPGGANTTNAVGYIVAVNPPKIGTLTFANGQLIFGGLNGPAGTQYRILSTTNLTTPLTSWKPVYTNFFASNGSFSFTNATTNAGNYFRLVSP